MIFGEQVLLSGKIYRDLGFGDKLFLPSVDVDGASRVRIIYVVRVLSYVNGLYLF